MNIRKTKINETSDYLQFSDLFKRSGLELNLDETGRGPEGFITAWEAVDEEGNLIGGAAITKKDGNFVLNDLAVEEAVRSQGIGGLLCQKAMMRMLDMGASRVYITSKAPLFFEKYGFRYLAEDEVPPIFQCSRCQQYGSSCNPKYMAFDYSGERLLFVDSCVTTHNSRTRRLCRHYLARFMEKHPGIAVDTVVVEKGCCQPLDREDIARRNSLIETESWDDPMFDFARQFKAADYVLVGAPYWDCAFPSILKVWIESIVVAGLTFEETEQGYVGNCKCRELTYITTAGGPILPGKNLGFDYLCAIGEMLGVKAFKEYHAECLDIIGLDHDAIMDEAVAAIDAGEADTK